MRVLWESERITGRVRHRFVRQHGLEARLFERDEDNDQRRVDRLCSIRERSRDELEEAGSERSRSRNERAHVQALESGAYVLDGSGHVTAGKLV